VQYLLIQQTAHPPTEGFIRIRLTGAGDQSNAGAVQSLLSIRNPAIAEGMISAKIFQEMNLNLNLKALMPVKLKFLSDTEIENRYASSVYAFNLAEPRSKEYYSLRQQARRWQALEYDRRTERYGFYTADGQAIQEPLIPKAPKPSWG